MDFRTLFCLTVIGLVMLCWFGFAAGFVFKKQPPQSPEQKREPGSLYGLLLQGLSYALVGIGHREFASYFLPRNTILSFVFGALAVLLGVASVGMAKGAVNVLGKEWSLSARVVEGHNLATAGPYGLVRHPIYTAMLGMLLATGLAVSHWLALFLAVLVFLVGTRIRVTREERLLHETFGAEFDNYARRVPAIIPGVW